MNIQPQYSKNLTCRISDHVESMLNIPIYWYYVICGRSPRNIQWKCQDAKRSFHTMSVRQKWTRKTARFILLPMCPSFNCMWNDVIQVTLYSNLCAWHQLNGIYCLGVIHFTLITNIFPLKSSVRIIICYIWNTFKELLQTLTSLNETCFNLG